MWLKVDDSLIDHPKMFAAGRHLGKGGRARAFCVYMAGLMWVNRHLTDGSIPDETVVTFTIDPRPIDVAEVLTFEDVRLWHRESNGYRIHDYHDHNPNADKVKEKLRADRDRKRKERDAKTSVGIPHGFRTDSTALARARSRSQPLCTLKKDHRATRAPSFQQPVENPNVLKALVWREVEAAYLEELDFSIPTVTERVKTVAARAHLVYGGDVFHQQIAIAMQRIAHARRAS